MLKTLNIAFAFLLLLITFNTATARTYNTENNNILVIKKNNETNFKKRRTFKVGTSIIYRTKKADYNNRGTIHAIEDNHIILIDDLGNAIKVDINQLTTIRRKYNIFVSLLGFIAGFSGYLSSITSILVLISMLYAPPSSTLSISVLLELLLLLCIFPAIFIGSIFGLARFRIFRLHKYKWKAEVQKLNE